MSDEGGDPACWAREVAPLDGVTRGSLLGTDAAPARGEHFETLVRMGGVTVEEIVSGADVEPASYEQDHDEWVVVLDGAATLDVDGTIVDLHAGDWVLLPAYVRHDVTRVEPGTRWLAVHGPKK